MCDPDLSIGSPEDRVHRDEMDEDVIEQMCKEAAEVLRGYGWTLTEPSGDTKQFCQAMHAAAQVLIKSMRRQNARARLVSQKDDKVPGFLDYYATEFLGLTSEDAQA